MYPPPAGIPERGVDFGLDAVTKGESTEFSTEILYEGELSFTDGMYCHKVMEFCSTLNISINMFAYVLRKGGSK